MSYLLCGLRVVSDLELDGVPFWRGPDREPDIEIRLGSVAPIQRNGDDYATVEVSPEGGCRLKISGIATFLVEGGSRITVDPARDANPTLIQVFLLGSAFGFLIHQRGLLPLHAGSVEIGGKVIAFAGESGAGKSTLVAAFVQAGFPMLSDDITVIDPTAAGGPVVLPSFPRIKLWQTALDALQIGPAALARVREELEKYLLPVDDLFRTAPLPLGAVYHLRQVNDQRQAGIELLRGKAAIDALLDAVYRRRSALTMGRHPALLDAAIRLGGITQAYLSRVPDLSALPETVRHLAALHS